MDLTSPATIKALLSKHQARPSKTMGQNFLIDKRVLQKIIDAAQITPEDTIIEVGPGIGNLTQALAQKANHVIAIEKDPTMIEIAKETLGDTKNVKLILGDILKTPLPLPKKYNVVANVPYYITSPIIRMFLETENQPEAILLMIQKEVAQRICAVPPNMSILAVSVQYYATAHIISTVSKACFWPSPNVDSAIIKIVPFKKPSQLSHEIFFKVVKAGFSHPRKQLANNLAKELNKTKESVALWLTSNNLNPLQRAETLTIEDWIHLAESMQ